MEGKLTKEQLVGLRDCTPRFRHADIILFTGRSGGGGHGGSKKGRKRHDQAKKPLRNSWAGAYGEV